MAEPAGLEAGKPVALVTGGSAGLGWAIAAALHAAGYAVLITGRDPQRLQDALQRLSDIGGASADVVSWSADVSDPEQVRRLLENVAARYGRLDVLVNAVGLSDRGMAESLTADRLSQLMVANVHTALLCSQAALPLLQQSGGTVVNIGSLAAKVGPRYLGGYAAAKHALAGLTQQMRLEWKPRGVHVALVSPGPIRREDAGRRYGQAVAQDADLPPEAAKPGGGTRVRGLEPQRVAQRVVRAIRRRDPDVLLPGHLRPLVAVGHLWPRLGDWLLLRFTRTKSDA